MEGFHQGFFNLTRDGKLRAPEPFSPLPWRWMALESLKTLTFSTKSDVWAYGVTLYEIFTLGDAPFPNESWTNEFVAKLESGLRMGMPCYSTQDIYSKIVTCWENEPELRPDFSTLCDFFADILKNCNSNTIHSNKIPSKTSFDNIDITTGSMCSSRPFNHYEVNNE